MPRILLGALCLPLLLSTTACGTAPQKPPTSALKQARNDAEARKDFEEYEKRHVAPPPAYGNKVVLAVSDSGRAAF